MSTSAQDWTTFSSFALLVPPAVLAYKHVDVFTFEICTFVLSTLASICYHECVTSDRAWCPSSRDVSEAYDILLAYLVVTVCVTPCIRMWLTARVPRGDWLAMAYAVGMCTLTFLVVVVYGDGLTAALAIGLTNGIAFLVTLGVHLTGATKPGAWWYARLTVGFACGIAAVVMRFLSAREFTSAPPPVEQPSLYDSEHTAWHALAPSAAVFFFSLLDDSDSVRPGGYTKTPPVSAIV
jgi:hypothetical protein